MNNDFYRTLVLLVLVFLTGKGGLLPSQTPLSWYQIWISIFGKFQRSRVSKEEMAFLDSSAKILGEIGKIFIAFHPPNKTLDRCFAAILGVVSLKRIHIGAGTHCVTLGKAPKLGQVKQKNKKL